MKYTKITPITLDMYEWLKVKMKKHSHC